MASASRDGTPGRGKKPARAATHHKPTGNKSTGSKSTGSKSTGSKSTGSKSTGSKSTGGKSTGGRSAAGKPGRASGAKQGAFDASRAKKQHRKGSSKPDVASGKVRLNNARPARHQLPADSSESGATYIADGVRLQKVLAAAGVASRRGAEELIAAGRVEVDGEVVTEQGMRINPDTAIIRVDGARVVVDEDKQYLALNKPKGWQSTMSDDQGRPCVGDIVAERVMAGQRLFHVGRLDADTEGLLLLTNDGELAHRLMHPSYEVPKTYLATVRGEVARSVGRQLRDGVDLEDGPVTVDSFTVVSVHEGQSMVRITLHEGRNRIVRRLLEEVGHPVLELVRTHLGVVTLGEQRPGSIRVLNNREIGELYKAVGL